MDRKTHALICYLTWIGWLIAILIYSGQTKKDKFVQFHLRQSLGLGLVVICCLVILSLAGIDPVEYSPFTLSVLIIFLAIWLYSFNIAMQEKTTPLPLLGLHFQRWFSWL